MGLSSADILRAILWSTRMRVLTREGRFSSIADNSYSKYVVLVVYHATLKRVKPFSALFQAFTFTDLADTGSVF